MLISIAPLVATHMDSKVVNAVITQLEIENHSTKGSGSDQAKDTLEKAGWIPGINKFCLSRPPVHLKLNGYLLTRDRAVIAFYPSVPTPPPNC